MLKKIYILIPLFVLSIFFLSSNSAHAYTLGWQNIGTTTTSNTNTNGLIWGIETGTQLTAPSWTSPITMIEFSVAAASSASSTFYVYLCNGTSGLSDASIASCVNSGSGLTNRNTVYNSGTTWTGDTNFFTIQIPLTTPIQASTTDRVIVVVFPTPGKSAALNVTSFYTGTTNNGGVGPSLTGVFTRPRKLGGTYPGSVTSTFPANGGGGTSGYEQFKFYFGSALYTSAISTQVLDPGAGTIRVTGNWNASSTASCASEYLDVWQEIPNLESHRDLSLHGVFPLVTSPITATTSGAFDFTFDIIDSSFSIGSTTTTYTLNPSSKFYARIYQPTCGYNVFTGEGVAPTILVATTTSTVATTSTVVQGGIDNNPWTGTSYGTSTLPDATNLLSFVNVPNLLATKVPFAYVFQISEVVYDLVVNNETSAASIPSAAFTINIPTRFGVSGVATATTTVSVDLFSTTTIAYFISPSYIGLLRGLMVAVTYFGCAFYLFGLARSHKLF